jgi:TRAP-type C4-dicarboxylate transport system permease small subunit
VRAVLALVTIAIILTFVGGVGWVASAVSEAHTTRMVFQWTLVLAMAITFAALCVAIVVGVYHLYLYLFTRKKPLSLFATTSRDEKP